MPLPKNLPIGTHIHIDCKGSDICGQTCTGNRYICKLTNSGRTTSDSIRDDGSYGGVSHCTGPFKPGTHVIWTMVTEEETDEINIYHVL